ncbi:membrane protein [Trueperella pyogenes]|uniref:YdcF family protein n=1 Tax=Trueperella pyogenes TaxID=1661 RepID=UPI00043AFB90|nr:YdcF family protein [Trueperella pyogenes]AHU89385.1 membrane protein [Trueperella pyogenes]AWA43349.1 YdcF family protein [Trueperella pyogenes]
MALYIGTALSLLAFFAFFIRDKRNPVNAFFFLTSLVAIYMCVIDLAYRYGSGLLHESLLGMIYVGIPVALVIFAAYMVVNGFVVWHRERVSLANSLSLMFGVAILVYAGIFVSYVFHSSPTKMLNYTRYKIQVVAFDLATFVFVIAMFIFFAFLAYSVLYATLPRRRDYDFIIIHGAGLADGVRVTPLLASRIDKAIEAFGASTNPKVKIIASGGQGPDEKVTEAEAIAEYTVSRGIAPERVLLEDRSTTTWQNLRMSKDLAVADSGLENPRFLFVTNNYHVLRTSFYARKLGLLGEGLGAKTARYYIPTAFMREYVAILVKLKWIIIGLFGLFAAFLFLSL